MPYKSASTMLISPKLAITHLCIIKDNGGVTTSNVEIITNLPPTSIPQIHNMRVISSLEGI